MMYEVSVGVINGRGIYDKFMMEQIGSMDAAVLYGQYCLSFESAARSGMLVTIDDQKWVPLAKSWIHEETKMGRTAQDNANKLLIDEGYIERRIGPRSLPCYRITDKLKNKVIETIKAGKCKYDKLVDRFLKFYLQETGEDLLQEVAAPAADQEPEIAAEAPAASVEPVDNSTPVSPDLIPQEERVHVANTQGVRGVHHKGSLKLNTGDGDIYIQAQANRILNSPDLGKLHDYLTAEMSFGSADFDRTIEYLITHSTWTGTFNLADCEAAADEVDARCVGANVPKYFAKALGSMETKRVATETRAERKRKRREQEEKSRSHRKVPFYNWLEDGPDHENETQKRPEEYAV